MANAAIFATLTGLGLPAVIRFTTPETVDPMGMRPGDVSLGFDRGERDGAYVYAGRGDDAYSLPWLRDEEPETFRHVRPEDGMEFRAGPSRYVCPVGLSTLREWQRRAETW